MQRRQLSIALYFCAMALTALLVAQLTNGIQPALRVGFWPMMIVGIYGISAFLLPCRNKRGGEIWLRCIGLTAVFLSPFLCWTARLSSCGLGFAPVAAHIYLQSATFFALLSQVALLIAWGGNFFVGGDGIPRRLKFLLWAPLYLLLIPALAALAGACYLSCTGIGPERVPLAVMPNMLWTLLFREPGVSVCAKLIYLSLAGQFLGILLVLLKERASRENDSLAGGTMDASPLEKTVDGPEKTETSNDEAD